MICASRAVVSRYEDACSPRLVHKGCGGGTTGNWPRMHTDGVKLSARICRFERLGRGGGEFENRFGSNFLNDLPI